VDWRCIVAAYPDERAAATARDGLRRLAGRRRAVALRRASGGALRPRRRPALPGGAGAALLRSVGDLLTPGTSALVAVVEADRARAVERWLAEGGANLVTDLMAAHVAVVEAKDLHTSGRGAPVASRAARGSVIT
jgi:hypothetical protein